MEDIPCKNSEEVQDKKLQMIVDAASEIYTITQNNKPIRILDLVTGPNGFNPRIANSLFDKGIDYELVLSDISPTWMRIGYNCLLEELFPEQMQKVKCILADATDLRKELPEIPLWTERTKRPLEEVLNDPRFYFLQTGYRKGKMIVDLSDNSFDIVTGCIPYSSIMFGDYSDAINESLRVLKVGGYHIIDEMHVVEINPNMYRTDPAMERAHIKFIDVIRSKLDAIMEPKSLFSATYPYNTTERNPSQSMQYKDTVKLSAIAHQKTISE